MRGQHRARPTRTYAEGTQSCRLFLWQCREDKLASVTVDELVRRYRVRAGVAGEMLETVRKGRLG